MSHKRLGALLATGIILAQSGLFSTIFAQAESKIASLAEENPVQVASVIQRPDIETLPDELRRDLPGFSYKATPDIYTIDLGPGRLPHMIQVVRQDDTSASLYVNGTEVLRFRDSEEAYDRAKVVANRLNRTLVTGEADHNLFKPAIINNQPIIGFDGEVLATVDESSAQALKQPSRQLAFTWTNRLRRALGETALQAQDFPQFTQLAADGYRGTGKVQTGVASWYGPGFHGRRTASGTRYNMYAMTAAHKSLPFGTMVRVTNARNQKSCVVKITDRGPYAHGRIIDLSKSAASAIGMSGVAPVKIEIVKKPG